MQTAIFPKATLAEFYRLALLLTGSSAAAECAMTEALSESDAHLDQMRHEGRRKTSFACRLRERCLRDDGPLPASAENAATDAESAALGHRFHAMPEPARSALALFYLDLFTAEEIAAMLKMTLEELGAALAEGRAFLQNSPPTA